MGPEYMATSFAFTAFRESQISEKYLVKHCIIFLPEPPLKLSFLQIPYLFVKSFVDVGLNI